MCGGVLAKKKHKKKKKKNKYRRRGGGVFSRNPLESLNDSSSTLISLLTACAFSLVLCMHLFKDSSTFAAGKIQIYLLSNKFNT
jgi:hypothetical protein